ncbi:MAG: DUF3604 domain-containing protein [Acidobacteria bacterium]|nr:DUF3604 domain-containing protein [Acidobacteriota bacterium]
MSRLVACLLLSAALLSAAPQRFLVLFGGADAEPSDWSGSLTARGGTARILAMHHFAPADSFDQASWKADNQMDADINLLPQEAPGFPKTKWKGVLVDVDGPESAVVTLRTAHGDAEFRTGAVRYLAPAALLDGRIRVERVPFAAEMGGPQADDDYPALSVGPDGRVWSAWIAHQDLQERVWLRYADDGETWSEPEEISPASGDYYQVELLATGPKTLLAVWSATVDGNVDLFERRFENGAWSAVERLTREPGPDTFPKLAAGLDGDVFLAWQSSGKPRTDISLKIRRNGRWSDAMKVTEHPASDWEPSLAVNSRGEAAVSWDSYRHGNYDVFLRRYRNGKLGPVERLTDSPDFEAHSSLAYDGRDRLWIAYDNGGPNWGKDNHGINGILRADGGLYAQRRVEVRVIDRGRLVQPVRPLDEKLPGKPILGSRMTLGLPSSYQTFTENPILRVDGRGRVWAVVRMRTIGRYNPPNREGRSILPYWTYQATLFDGAGWTAPVSIPFSDGRQEQRAAAAVDRNGDLWVSGQTDGWSRPRTDPAFAQYDLYVGKIAMDQAAAGPVDQELMVGVDSPRAPQEVDDQEPRLVAPLYKTYEMDVAGQRYKVTWGDLHRHTDLSFDGQSDGSMYDVYRYAIDAAEMDFLGPSEHLLPQDDLSDYVWRMVDKAVDVYKLPGFFYPLLNYERTVAYPDGHRNIVSRSRGYQPLRILPGEGPSGAAENDQLYLWQKLLAGKDKPDALSIPHTTATQMGTDWRYNDERVERLVEMYQGNRDSYEYYGAPKGAVAEQIVVGGYITSGAMRPKGFIWNALAKGYKMGFIASSDHRATHISYAAVYTPEVGYNAIWDSLYARRTYAATDYILVDFQCQGHAMGEEFATSQIPRLDIGVIGTGKIKQLDVIKNNKIIYTAQPGVQELSMTYVDRAAEPGESYYYVRVIQDDDNMAWASPIWVTLEK